MRQLIIKLLLGLCMGAALPVCAQDAVHYYFRTMDIRFKDRDRGGVGNDSSNRNNVGRLISSVDCDIYVAVDKECGACYIFPIKEFVENKLTIGQRKKGISTDEAEAFFEKWDIIRIVAEKKRIEAGE